MFLRLFSVLYLVISISRTSQAAVPAADSSIRVRIIKKQSQIRVTGFGLRIVGDPVDLPTKKSWLVVRADNRWRIWDQTAIGSNNNSKYREYLQETIEIDGESIKIEDLSTQGKIRLTGVTAHQMDLVVELSIEDYLLGVLPSEMPATWPLDTLKAQAVASRTYAMAVKESRAGEYFHVDSTVENQVFIWSRYQHLASNLKEKVDAAIRTTAGMYLVNEYKAPIWTYFHSHCGGETTVSTHVWGNYKEAPHRERKHTVKDSHCQMDREGAWQATIPAKTIEEKLLSLSIYKKWQHYKIAEIKNSTENSADIPARILARSPSRFEYLKLILRRGSELDTVFMSGQDFREAMGYTTIKSTLFNIEQKNDHFIFTGQGRGHGVGLCQAGARFMALSGKKFNQILSRYYPDVELSVPMKISDSNPNKVAETTVSF